LMETADELLKFSAGEEAEVEKLIKALADNGVNVVVSAGKFGDIHLHFMNKYKMMGVRLVSKFDLRRLCRSTGAQAQARVCCPPATAYGECDRVYIEEVGGKELTVFDKASERGNIATIVIRGSSQSRMDDVERAINDAVNTYKALTRDSNLLAGAGAAEIELARQIESFGEKWAGLEQYSIKKFAHALETLPKQVAENAGLDPTEILSKIYAAHQEGQQNAGIDILNGGILDAVEADIYDLYSGKRSAIKLGADAAVTILKVDQIIMSKQAKGPAPRAPKAADEADED
uniref:T-complex protein 1 subunit theta n=1 Tax=Gongylonema pulchrum TaxID=637853 RepID=A0A183EAV4_9BILA